MQSNWPSCDWQSIYSIFSRLITIDYDKMWNLIFIQNSFRTKSERNINSIRLDISTSCKPMLAIKIQYILSLWLVQYQKNAFSVKFHCKILFIKLKKVQGFFEVFGSHAIRTKPNNYSMLCFCVSWLVCTLSTLIDGQMQNSIQNMNRFEPKTIK